MECIHLPFDTGGGSCSVCRNGPTPRKAPKPSDRTRHRSHGLKADEGDVLIMGILEDVVCSFCMTSRSGIGCVCSRNAIGFAQLASASRFLEQWLLTCTPMEFQTAKHLAPAVAMSVFKRVSRRMEWTAEEQEDARLGMMQQFQIDPKWGPSRHLEPTHLPI